MFHLRPFVLISKLLVKIGRCIWACPKQMSTLCCPEKARPLTAKCHDNWINCFLKVLLAYHGSKGESAQLQKTTLDTSEVCWHMWCTLDAWTLEACAGRCERSAAACQMRRLRGTTCPTGPTCSGPGSQQWAVLAKWLSSSATFSSGGMWCVVHVPALSVSWTKMTRRRVKEVDGADATRCRLIWPSPS